MATAFKSTNQVLDVIVGQLREQLDDIIDEVFIFDGLLQDAIVWHMNTAKNAKTFLFVGMPGDEPEERAGTGLRLRSRISIDIYVVVRTSGKSRYEADLYRLFDASDAVVFTAFEHSNLNSDFVDHIASMESPVRTREDTAEADGVLSHSVRFDCIPRR